MSIRVPGAPSITSSRESSAAAGWGAGAAATAAGEPASATFGDAEAQPVSRAAAASAATSPSSSLTALFSLFTASPMSLASLAYPSISQRMAEGYGLSFLTTSRNGLITVGSLTICLKTTSFCEMPTTSPS